MKAIRLYDWKDKQMQHLIKEVAVLRSDDATRNKKRRIYVWSADDEFNYLLYPDYGTAYPEFDNRVQEQRYAERYLYEVVE